MKGEAQSMPGAGKADTARSDFALFDLVDVVCVAITIVLVLAIATKEQSALRIVAAVIFVFFIPGRAVVSNWTLMEARSNFALSVLFSLAILVLASTVVLWMNLWHPLGLLQIEGVITSAALIRAVVRRNRKQPAPDAAATESEPTQ